MSLSLNNIQFPQNNGYNQFFWGGAFGSLNLIKFNSPISKIQNQY